MRIAYLLESNFCVPSGILSKISGQSAHWKQFGHQVKFFSLHTEDVKVEKYKVKSLILHNEEDVEIFFSRYSNLFNDSLPVKNYLNKILTANALKKAIDNFKPDIIYYRQGIWYPGLMKALNNSYPIIMEVNTLDVEEVKHNNLLRQKLYLYGREKIINKLSGIVAVTEEIAKAFSAYGKPTTVIGNAYDYSLIPNLQGKDNIIPQIIFVGSPNMAWHGIDKVIKMAKLLPEFTFNIVGPVVDVQGAENIIVHGYLKKNELFNLYKKMNIGIGSLSLHRNNMDEACPLKVREYCAFGLPIILGYKDTDLDGKHFVLNIGNDESNVENHIKDIKAFIVKWHNKVVDREITRPIIDYQRKEMERIAFFENFVK